MTSLSKEVGSEDGATRAAGARRRALPPGRRPRGAGRRRPVGRPIEVHVLADPSKPAKQTVRDVRAVAQTVFGIELDHRIVSVAQLNTNDAEHAGRHRVPPRVEARARVGASINSRGRRTARRGARRARRRTTASTPGSPKARWLAIGAPAARRRRPHSTRCARASRRRKRSTSRAPRSAASAATGSRSSPSSTSSRRLELVVSGLGDRAPRPRRRVARALLDATNRRLARMPSAGARSG